jgi:protein required for attachment to host cells
MLQLDPHAEDTMHGHKSWVVLSDGGEARFYEGALVPDGLRLIETWEAPGNPPSRMQGTGSPGRVYESVGGQRHAVEPRQDAHEAAKEAFARRICDHLDKAVEAGRIEELVIAAPPRFLGELRRHQSEHVRRVLRTEIDKDLTGLPLKEAIERIRGEA